MLDAPIHRLLEHEVLETGDGYTKIRFVAKPEFMIPGQVVQGGIVAAMLDHAMAFADDGRFSTASLSVEILRPVIGPDLIVTARITQRGRRIVFADAEMRDSSGKLLARGTQTAVPTDESSDSETDQTGAE